jgi:ribonucleotide monophosphatase NagD (HAD superfamily)
LKRNKEIESALTKDKRTLEKRKEVKEKLKQLGATDEHTEQILTSIERYCQLVLHSIKKSEYG